MALLLHYREQAFPGEVEFDALGLLHDDPNRLQRIHDLDAVPVDVLVKPVLVDGVGKVHRGLLMGVTAVLAAAATGDQHVGVLDPEVGVVADAGDQEDLSGAVMGVEVGAVVEVTVRGARPGDRLGDLVDGVFIERSEHQGASPISRFSSPPW